MRACNRLDSREVMSAMKTAIFSRAHTALTASRSVVARPAQPAVGTAASSPAVALFCFRQASRKNSTGLGFKSMVLPCSQICPNGGREQLRQVQLRPVLSGSHAPKRQQPHAFSANRVVPGAHLQPGGPSRRWGTAAPCPAVAGPPLPAPRMPPLRFAAAPRKAAVLPCCLTWCGYSARQVRCGHCEVCNAATGRVVPQAMVQE